VNSVDLYPVRCKVGFCFLTNWRNYAERYCLYGVAFSAKARGIFVAHVFSYQYCLIANFIICFRLSTVWAFSCGRRGKAESIVLRADGEWTVSFTIFLQMHDCKLRNIMFFLLFQRRIKTVDMIMYFLFFICYGLMSTKFWNLCSALYLLLTKELLQFHSEKYIR
jgi:hypothetical protein